MQDVIGFDTETHLITPARQCPRLVCVSNCVKGQPGVYGPAEGLRTVLRYLESGQHLTAHNAAFDLTVLIQAAFDYLGSEFGLHFTKAVFTALCKGTISCTVIRQKLADLSRGMLRPTGAKAKLPSESGKPHKKKAGVYSLAGCLWRHMRIDRGADKAEGAVRYSYYLVDGLPPAQWPAEYLRYAGADAVDHVAVWRVQQQKYSGSGCFAVEPERVRAAFVLRLLEVWGVRTDPDEVQRLAQHCDAVADRIYDKMIALGLAEERYSKGQCKVSVRTSALQHLTSEAYRSAGREVPLTDHATDPQVKTDADTLLAIAEFSRDPRFAILPEYSKAKIAASTRSKYVKALCEAALLPLHARFNALLETGRTSASKYMQTPPRDSLDCYNCGMESRFMPAGTSACPKCGDYIGDVRSCYVARPGYTLASVDYAQLELCALAQMQHSMFGRSMMGDAICNGYDLHSVFGADLIPGCDYETFLARKKNKEPEAVRYRQVAKGGNFGLPGGMGAKAFVNYVHGYGVLDFELRESKVVKGKWLQRWADMPQYFAAIKGMGLAAYGATTQVVHPVTGMQRGNCGYTQACNYMFQHLAAAGALDAGFHLAREMFADPHSPLYGSRLWNFIHDEWICEHPETRAPEAADRQATVMQAVMQRWCPAVPITDCEPALMDRWYKGAETVRDSAGTLLKWRPAA